MIRAKYQRKRVLDLSVASSHAGFMRQRRLGTTDPTTDGLSTSGLATSALGLGCMGLSQGYGPNDDESIRVIHSALDLGVTLLDTAMSYGQGHNEQLIARALAGRREHLTLATKFGIVRDKNGVHVDAQPDRVRDYCEASLERLGTDVIDLFYLHRVDPNVPIAETVGAMADLVAAGKVRHLGLSEVTVDQLEQAVAVHPIAAVQFEWSLLWRDPENDIVPAARRLGIGLVPYSPLGRGLLTATLTAADIDISDFRRTDDRFHGEHLTNNIEQVNALRAVADDLGITAGQLALGWLLAQGPDVVPIPGTRRRSRLVENVRAANIDLSPTDLQRLDQALTRSAWSGDRHSFAVPVTTRIAP
jgi:aryl-alcohol dehydrogenase-like predicted oxidoreductase